MSLYNATRNCGGGEGIPGTRRSCGVRNSGGLFGAIPLSGTKNFDHKDPRNAVTMEGHKSIGYLKGAISTQAINTLTRGLYRNLEDLKEVSPEGIPGIGDKTLHDIHDILKISFDKIYRPKWTPPKLKRRD